MAGSSSNDKTTMPEVFRVAAGIAPTPSATTEPPPPPSPPYFPVLDRYGPVLQYHHRHMPSYARVKIDASFRGEGLKTILNLVRENMRGMRSRASSSRGGVGGSSSGGSGGSSSGGVGGSPSGGSGGSSSGSPGRAVGNGSRILINIQNTFSEMVSQETDTHYGDWVGPLIVGGLTICVGLLIWRRLRGSDLDD